MLSILLVRPGSTEFDEEGRIKGNLDMPMSPKGSKQVEKLVADLSEHSLATVYAAAGQACEATAKSLAAPSGTKVKLLPKLTRVAGFEWGTGFYINPTSVLFNNYRARYMKALTGTDAHVFGRKKRVKYARQYFIFYTNAIIRYSQND